MSTRWRPWVGSIWISAPASSPTIEPLALPSAEAVAIKALSLAPDHAFAHLVLGSSYSAVNRGEEAIAQFEHA
jgi:hypothetical protein